VEGEVQGLSVERRGIEPATVPLHHLLMFGMSRISHHPEEMGVTAHSTDVIWRARSGSAENPGIASARPVSDGFLQQEFVLPTVTEIILIDHPVLGLPQEIVQPRPAFLVPLHRSGRANPRPFPTGLDRVHVTVGPAHHCLCRTPWRCSSVISLRTIIRRHTGGRIPSNVTLTS
jgi:hypothetical protein